MKRTPTKLFPLLCAAALLASACGGSDPAAVDVELPLNDDVINDFPVDPDDTGGDIDDEADGSGDDGALPGDGVPLGGGSYAVGTIKVLIEHPELDPVSYELACFGDTATLIPDSIDGVSADRACTALADADVEDYLVNGPAEQACTEQYGGADTAHITGMLSGNDIDIVVDRVNGCGIDAWDLLLADVLPVSSGLL